MEGDQHLVLKVGHRHVPFLGFLMWLTHCLKTVGKYFEKLLLNCLPIRIKGPLCLECNGLSYLTPKWSGRTPRNWSSSLARSFFGPAAGAIFCPT